MYCRLKFVQNMILKQYEWGGLLGNRQAKDFKERNLFKQDLHVFYYVLQLFLDNF